MREKEISVRYSERKAILCRNEEGTIITVKLTLKQTKAMEDELFNLPIDDLRYRPSAYQRIYERYFTSVK